MRILNNKVPKADIKQGYHLKLEMGMVVALLLFIVIFNLHLRPGKEKNFTPPKQETVKMKEIVQTKIHNKPPPPPAPKVPVAVPNDAVINDQPIDLNSELSAGSRLQLPPPPKKEKKQAPDQHQVFVAVQKMPHLIGGLAGLQKNVHYPELARKAGIEGTVYLQFVVNRKGIPTDIKVIRSVGAGLDQAAIDALKQAHFTPGMQRGRPVNVRMSMPVRFELQN